MHPAITRTNDDHIRIYAVFYEVREKHTMTHM